MVLCLKVSYGEMVACDNPECQLEWFHFACVGLETKPKVTTLHRTAATQYPSRWLICLFDQGKWFCSDCKKKIRKQRVEACSWRSGHVPCASGREKTLIYMCMYMDMLIFEQSSSMHPHTTTAKISFLSFHSKKSPRLRVLCSRDQ